MNSQLKRRPLGDTGEMVTEISLGAMNLRTLETEAEGIAVIRRALDLGINLIDTARAYIEEKPDGRLIESEVLVKKAICEHESIGEPIIIVTKGHGYDIPAFDEHLKISLEKLGVEQGEGLTIGGKPIKLVYLYHGISQERYGAMKASGVLEHAKQLQQKGAFDYLGFSSHNGHEECIKEALESGYFQVTELPYNVFNPGLEGLLKLAQDNGVGVINMKAFGGNGMVSKSKMFEDYCDISPEKRLSFCLASPYIATIDVGCKYIPELELDVKMSARPMLSAKECKELVETARRVGEVTEDTCKECTHCLEKFECPKGIDFPKILVLHTKLKIAEEFDGDIAGIQEQYQTVKEEAAKCVECGACNPWCEYKLDIPKILNELKAAF